MRVTWNWLAEFVDLELPVSQLADRLTMSGLEVEAIEERGRDCAGVICAEIVQVRPHPHAERLTVCQVRTGGDATVTVVCGAPNVQAGNRVAYAPPGAKLPGNRQITTAEIGDISSAGMLCSEAELGIGPDASRLLILPADAAIGARVAAVLGLEDTVLDIAVTPNRGDCLSVLGLAREIAALTGQQLQRRRFTLREAEQEAAADLITISIADADLCGRYVGRVISDLKPAPSPLWMQSRLEAVGIRPLVNVVDVTNYVMIERGQPLHAFDYDRLHSKEIIVRRAAGDASFTTLDGQVRALQADDLMIATPEGPVALAGVMGGADTEVTAATQRVLLESAWFAPSGIRRTAKRLGLRTEASYRFERTIDIEQVPHAADRAAALIAKFARGIVARGRVDAYPSARPPAPISLRLKRVDDLLGIEITRADIGARLKSLGMAVSPATRGTLTVVPPTYRSDLSREIDLIEEIARVGGYENVPATLPECSISGTGHDAEEMRQRSVRRFLAAQGLNEVVPLSFCSSRMNALFPGFGGQRSPVAILNPVTQDETEMRLSLCPGLVRTARENLVQGAANVAAFALSKVFWRDDGVHEALHLGGVICRSLPNDGLRMHDSVAEFAGAKGVVEALIEFLGIGGSRWTRATDLPAFHPGKTARVVIGGTPVGIVGCLHPAIEEELKIDGPCWMFELDLERLLDYCPARVVYRELPRFPAVVRDVAIVTEEGFASDRVIHFVLEWNKASQLIEDIRLFDQYVGPPIPPGKKSLAYSLSYRAPDRTLTDAEVNTVHAQLLAALKDALQVETR
jgi:phenylalanyl-tRNA synthetase beta chain